MKLTVRMIRVVSKHYAGKDRNIYKNVAKILLELGYIKSSKQGNQGFVNKHADEVLHLYNSVPKKQSYKEYLEESHRFLSSFEWKRLRMQAFNTYGNRCQCCGADARTTTLNVDHIKPRYTHPELQLDINNLQILCSDCNKGKGNWLVKDYRDGE